MSSAAELILITSPARSPLAPWRVGRAGARDEIIDGACLDEARSQRALRESANGALGTARGDRAPQKGGVKRSDTPAAFRRSWNASDPQ
jgi:hypothetical protein